MPSPQKSPGDTAPAALREFPLAELVTTASYMLVGGLWILGTDALVSHILGEPRDSTSLQSVKGLNFVATTGLLLYLVLRRSFQRHRRAEAAAAQGHERLELAARAATDAIWDLDVAAGKLWWSDGIEKLFGYPKADVPPTLDFWTERLHPEERERVKKGFYSAIEGTGDLWSDEYRFRCRDGHYSFVQDRGFIIRDPAGKARRMVGGMSDITQRKEAEQRIERSRRQLRALSARLANLREEERTRIAREIHDELGQLLTALKLDLRWMEKKLEDHAADPALNSVLDKLVQTVELADHTIAAVQKIASELRPGILDNLGLSAALAHEAGSFQKRTGLVCDLVLPETVPELSRDATTAVFRIFQEALTNIARHAEATRVRCEFKVDGDQAVLRIEDNGRGISPDALADPKSLGLLGMQERAAVLSGEVRIEPASPAGTRVILRLPCAADDTRFWSHI